ncbi:MAG: DUF4391 domain-containing protein [Bacteroides sp.]|nr:DUF4391 domain-containing protein [Bacteroides sp.]
MLGLPPTTEVKRPLPKTQLFKRFDWTASQRERFDAEVSRLDVVNWISPRTVPAIAAGNEVKEIMVVDVLVKSREFDAESIVPFAKYLPYRTVFVLRYEDEAMLAAYHGKLFTAPWQHLDSISLTLSGLNLDAVWENIVSTIGDFSVEQDNSLTEQIKIDEERDRHLRRIEALERQMKAAKQPRRKRELFVELQRLKGGFNE